MWYDSPMTISHYRGNCTMGFDDASPGYHVSPGVGELHIGDTGDNL